VTDSEADRDDNYAEGVSLGLTIPPLRDVSVRAVSKELSHRHHNQDSSFCEVARGTRAGTLPVWQDLHRLVLAPAKPGLRVLPLMSVQPSVVRMVGDCDLDSKKGA